MAEWTELLAKGPDGKVGCSPEVVREAIKKLGWDIDQTRASVNSCNAYVEKFINGRSTVPAALRAYWDNIWNDPEKLVQALWLKSVKNAIDAKKTSDASWRLNEAVKWEIKYTAEAKVEPVVIAEAKIPKTPSVSEHNLTGYLSGNARKSQIDRAVDGNIN
jgi:hypothetical protein